jgi:segregation and condensation protein B
VTRGEIEDIRGVAVSTSIVQTLLEREWIKVIGHKEVPGRPALYATTKDFLDYFNLKSLSELPTLMEIADLDLNVQAENAQQDTRERTETQPNTQADSQIPAVPSNEEASSAETAETPGTLH